jgi:hypothetical protein
MTKLFLNSGKFELKETVSRDCLLSAFFVNYPYAPDLHPKIFSNSVSNSLRHSIVKFDAALCRIARVAQFLKFYLICDTSGKSQFFFIDSSFKSYSMGPRFDQLIQRYAIWSGAMQHSAEPWSRAMGHSLGSWSRATLHKGAGYIQTLYNKVLRSAALRGPHIFVYISTNSQWNL